MLKLVKAHFHKDKAVLLAFLLILTVASMLLHTSLMVARYDSMYEEKFEKQGVSDSIFFCLGDEDKINAAINDMDYVDSSYLVDIIIPDMVTLSETKISKACSLLMKKMRLYIRIFIMSRKMIP